MDRAEFKHRRGVLAIRQKITHAHVVPRFGMAGRVIVIMIIAVIVAERTTPFSDGHFFYRRRERKAARETRARREPTSGLKFTVTSRPETAA